MRIGIHHFSRRRVAIKVVDKARLTDPAEAKRMQREIRVMRHLTHPCVIKLFEVRSTKWKIWIVFLWKGR